MTTSADRQAAYRKRMRKAGFKQVLLWIQPERQIVLEYFAKALRDAESSDDIWFHNKKSFPAP